MNLTAAYSVTDNLIYLYLLDGSTYQTMTPEEWGWLCEWRETGRTIFDIEEVTQ